MSSANSATPGTTQAGRDLRLYYQGSVNHPTGVTITGTLDGVVIEISGITQRMGPLRTQPPMA